MTHIPDTTSYPPGYEPPPPPTDDPSPPSAADLNLLALNQIARAIERTNEIMITYLRMTISTAVATYEAMPEESRETIAPMFAELKQFLQDTDDEVESSPPDR